MSKNIDGANQPDGAPVEVSVRLREIVEEAAACSDDGVRRALIDSALVNFGAEFVKLVSEDWNRDQAKYNNLYEEMFARCRAWLSGDKFSERANEDARRARFALWFCGMVPGLARVASRVIFKLPEGHPDRDVKAVRDLLIRQLQFAVESRIPTASALDAIAGILQMDLFPAERSLGLIAAGRRIIEREQLLNKNDNFRGIAAACLQRLANEAQRRHQEDEADWLRRESQAIVDSLDAVRTPARDELLLKSLFSRGEGKVRSDLLRQLAPKEGSPDGIALFAAREEARDFYYGQQYREVIDLLTPLLPIFEERYLTSIEARDIEETGGELSEVLLRAAFSHAQLGAWADALRLVDQGKSLRIRYEHALREATGANRVLDLQAAMLALERGLEPETSLPDVDPASDPVGAKLSLRSRLVEAYREQRGALLSEKLEGTDIKQIATCLGDDRAALILGESGDGLLTALVTGHDVEAPWAASLLPPHVLRSIVEIATNPGTGWLVAAISPAIVDDPAAALNRLLTALDDTIGRPVAEALRQLGLGRLVVVAHNFLHLVPFWALPSFAELELMIVPSAHHLAGLQATPARLHGRALVVGNPTLDLRTAEVESAIVADALRGAGFEVGLISGRDATEEALNARVAGSAVLHFAGHGRSDAMRPLQSALEVHPDLERWQPVDNGDPLLSLAGAAGFTEFKDNERWADVPGEGRLYERIFPVSRRTELRLEYGLRGTLLGQYADADDPNEGQRARLRLSELWSAGDLITGRLLDGCGLAFLSSCEAGQGGLTVGLDEHAGLPAAIELAGARAIVSPLWRVDDVASAVFAQLFYEGLLCSSGEIDLGTLVSRTRFSMRDMSAVEASRRVREIASVAKRGTTRFALEAEAIRIERDSTPPFAEPLSWAAFYLTGASRVVVGVDAKGLTVSQPAEKLPRVDRTPHVATQVRPLVEAVPDAPQAQPDAPSQPVADLWLAVAKDSGNPDLVREAIRHLYERFLRRLKRQQIDAAGEDVTKILELDGNSAEAHDALGALALAKNDIDSAIGSLDRALEINPALVSAYNNRAKALLARMDPRRAIADCTTALDLAPRDRELLGLRGMAWIAAGDLLSALADFITGVQCDPDDPASYIGKAMVLAHLQRHEQALEACTEAIERRPEEGATYLQRSLSRAALNEVDKAFADCETAILLLPDSSSAYAQKGFLLAAVGELDLALEEYRRAIEANSGIPQIYFSRACVLSMSETAGTIVEDLEHAIGAHPQFRLLARMAPELEWARNNLDRVRELLADDAG